MIENLHKITIPRGDHLILRDRLNTGLKGSGKAVTWIAARPGSGKTSAVVSWIRATGKNALWYNVDQADEDLANFFYYLKMAASISPAIEKADLDSFPAGSISFVQTFSQNFFENLLAACRENSVLVIDDLQKISSKAPLHRILADNFPNISYYIKIIVISHRTPHEPYIQLRSRGEINLIREKDLNFTKEETFSVIDSAYPKIPDAEKSAIFERTQGWAAGIVLLSEQLPHKEKINIEMKLKKGEASVSTYFSQEVFNSFPSDFENFLLITSLIPRFTLELAKRLVVNSQVDEFIRQLLLNHLFLEETTGSENRSVYQYHPLFKDYLCNEAKKKFSSSEITGIKEIAANNYFEEGQIEDALTVFYEINNREKIYEILVNYVDLLLQTGRYNALQKYLDIFNDKDYPKFPLVPYWRGKSIQPFDLMEGLHHFQRAFAIAERKNDHRLSFLCWVEIVNGIVYLKNEYSNINRWLAWIEKNREQLFVKELEPVKFKVISALLMANTFSEQSSDKILDIPFWHKLAIDLFRATENPEYIISLGTGLFYQFAIYGRFIYCRMAIEKMEPLMERIPLNPFLYVRWQLTQSWYHYSITGDMSRSIAHAKKANLYMQKTGIRTFEFDLLLCSSFCLIFSGHRKELQENLRCMAVLKNRVGKLQLIQYYQVLLIDEMLQYNFSMALEYIETMDESIGPPNLFITNQILYYKTIALLESGKADLANDTLERLHQSIRRNPMTGSDYIYNLTRAFLAIKNGVEDEFIENAGALMMNLKEAGLFCMNNYLSIVVRPVLKKALTLKIEPDLAEKFLDILQPRDPGRNRDGQANTDVLLARSGMGRTNGQEITSSRKNPDWWLYSEINWNTSKLAHVKNMRILFEQKKIYRDPELSLELLAKELGITRHHLSELLNKELDTNFYAMLRTCRIKEARELLLLHPDRTILEIAFAVGFNNKNSFNRTFKEIMGMSPSQYRKHSFSGKVHSTYTEFTHF